MLDFSRFSNFLSAIKDSKNSLFDAENQFPDLGLVSTGASRKIHEEWQIAIFVKIIHQLLLDVDRFSSPSWSNQQ